MTVPSECTSLPAVLIVIGMVLIAVSGVPGLFLPRGSHPAQKLAALLVLAGSMTGAAGALAVILSGTTFAGNLAGRLALGGCETGIDPLSALFLLPIFFVASCSAFFSVHYRPAPHHTDSTRPLTLFFGLMTAAMTCLLMTRNMIIFLIAWEVMALAAWFLLTADGASEEVRESGFLYLVATHTGSLALFALFSLLYRMTGSFRFPEAASLDGSTPLAAAVLIAALVGFGMKAGIVPCHIWLPPAHANAPGTISAIMSGVVIKMGIYGLLRTLSFFSHEPLWWGETIMAAGIVTAIFGIASALGQGDLKRLLAYSSVENIGIITLGIGVAVVGRSTASIPLVVLGLGGALLHLVNHSLFKPLLFLNTGALMHSVGSRQIEKMGGLIGNMPKTAAIFLVGAVAICGLPPLNGFVGEYLIYLGLFSGIGTAAGNAPLFFAVGAASLALVGGIAAACFLKAFGTAFLGQHRSPEAASAREAEPWLLVPMAILTFLCLAVGLAPAAVLRLLRHPLEAWFPPVTNGPDLTALAPVSWLTATVAILIATALILAMLLRKRLISCGRTTGTTWGCGYARPTPRMQYSGSSFSENLTTLFRGVLRNRATVPALEGPFPATRKFETVVPDPVLDLCIRPAARLLDRVFSFCRKLQFGESHLYLLYILVTLTLLLVWAH